MKLYLSFFSLICLFFFSTSIAAQEKNCGTDFHGADMDYLDQQNKLWQLHQLNSPESGTTLTFVPVQLHIIRTSAGTGGISPSDYLEAFERVNVDYLPAGINFFQCSSINYIDDDDYYDYDKSEMNALHAAHSVTNVINIYSTEDVLSGSSPICGHAQFPGGLDFVMLANSCTLNGSTFSHELGHYFNLYHTHTTSFGVELVNGTNCAVAGDFICDTPADPVLSSSNMNAGGCDYYGTGTDPNGSTYLPDVTNKMSYSRKECRTYFSPDQLDRMALSLVTSRSYLTCSNSISFEADYYYNYSQNCTNNISVDFSDATAAGAIGWTWDFGDGMSSTDASPTHMYATPGLYDVSLTATNGIDTDTETKNYIVSVGAKSLPYFQNFESGVSALGDFNQDVTYKNSVEVSSDAANQGNNGLVLEGYNNSSSPSFQTPTSANAFEALWNPNYKCKLDVCINATSAVSQLQLDFDLRQLYGYNSNYTNFRVLADGTQIGSVYQATSANENNWTHVTLDLSAYAGSVFTLSFEASNKYSRSYLTTNGNATYIDNIEITSTTILPVDLAEFTATWNKEEKVVDLDWKTLSETNNKYFEIQKSIDGNSWKRIGTKVGKGNTLLETLYDFQDVDPFVGINYYRLKQVDFDGTFEYSNIASVRVENFSSPISVFPNPVSDLLNIQTSENIENITLFNSVGLQFNLSVQESNHHYQLDVSSLSGGIYFLQINNETPIKIVIE
ncbi:MAG: PKD domain-containing protein [Saprospiraceae bacterium]